MAFKIIDEGSDFFTVKEVPIFQMHADRGFPCDAVWMDTAVQNHALLKAGGYRPTIVVGHNRKGGVEKESVGFLDNLVVKGKRLYADLVRIPKAIKEKIVKNAYPNRSVEVLPKSKRILCMALLGGTTPHFPLPQVVYENKEESEWHNYDWSNEMLTDEQKKELYELVGTAVAETVPELLMKFLSENGEGKEEDTETFIDPDTNEEYAIPAALAKILSAGGKTAGKVAGKRGSKTFGKVAGKAIGGVARHPAVAGAAAGAAGGVAVGRLSKRGQGYAIDEDTGEIAFDGEPVGVIVTYNEMAEAGMDVPTAVKRPDALPVVKEAKPALNISAGAVGPKSDDDGTLKNPVSPPGGPALIDPLDRDESDQFTLEEVQSQNYDLNQRLETVETANALITQGRRAEEYEKWLTEQKASGAPVGDIGKTVDYMMSQEPDAVEEFKKLLLASPKVAFGKIDEVKQFEIASEDTIKADYSVNKDTYKALGVSEKDLAYAKYTRINRGVGEMVLNG